jgi:sporulation protein YlmC with PRC-barrel domain
MLRNVNDLRGYAICATDGAIGKVDDFYFDDQDWGVRYLIVETGSWLSSRKVLISPIALGHAGWMGRQLPVALTRAQVEGSPDIDTRKPVSRQQETDYFAYYGYPYYWGGAGLWGMGAYPGSLMTQGKISQSLNAHRAPATGTPDDCHLRSCKAVIGHHVEATDGRVGHVEDMVVDDYTWAIRHLIVATSTWSRGEALVLPPHTIKKVSWLEKQVFVDMTRHAIREGSYGNPAARCDQPERRRA